MITWDKIVKAVAGAAGAVWGLFGGRDTMLTVMLALMAIDYGTGLLIGWMGKSPKQTFFIKHIVLPPTNLLTHKGYSSRRS